MTDTRGGVNPGGTGMARRGKGYDEAMVRFIGILALTASAFACSWSYPIWIPRSPSADALYRFEKDGKAGYIDETGKVVIPPTLELYSSGGEFHDGLLEVSASDGKYIDRTGQVVVNPGLERGWDFSEGLAVAMKKGEKVWGFIGTDGEFHIQPRFATYPQGYVHSFSDGLAMIETEGRFGYVDHAGRFVIEPRFADGQSFSNGFARVVVEGPCTYIPDGPCGVFNAVTPGAPKTGKAPTAKLEACRFSYIDKTGQLITAAKFDAARDFSEGLAPVRVGKVWGFIDKTGKVVIQPQFEDAERFFSGRARVRVGQAYGYIDKTGTMVIPPQFRFAEDFSQGFAVVNDGKGASWYIDDLGRKAFGEVFEAASPFFKGLAHVKLRPSRMRTETYAYIDTIGRQVFTY